MFILKFSKYNRKSGLPAAQLFRYVKNIVKYTKKTTTLKVRRCQNLFLKNRKSALTIMAIKTTKDKILIVVSTIFNHLVFILFNRIFNPIV
jgi:hypothetical protein